MSDGGDSAAPLRALISDAYYGATLRGVDFTGASLVSVSGPSVLFLKRCIFTEADLRQATLDGWWLTLCDLRSANLRGASLRGARFVGCDLTGADLRGTDLTHAIFGSVGVGEGARETQLAGALFDPGVVPTLE
jgi:uncharacterized protein YjbI with pentapeptide repeats